MAYNRHRTIEYILEKATITDGCWLWPTKSTSGYGYVYLGGGRKNQIGIHAHRLSYEIAKGPVPPGLVLDHLCRNPSCVNPEHLEAVSDKVNIRRGVGLSAHFAGEVKCVSGHTFPRNQSRYYVKRGWRRCLECHREREAARRAKQRQVVV